MTNVAARVAFCLIAPTAGVLVSFRQMAVGSAWTPVATVPVVVAVRDMPEGVSIRRGAIAISQWPVRAVPLNSFTAIDSVANRVTRIAIYKGEAIVPGRLTSASGAELAVKIAPGKRAYGIRINDVARLSGLVRPNSRVDIMVVISDPAHAGKQVAKLFMSNVRVLGIGDAPERMQDGRLDKSAVASVEVTPEEAETLAIAAGQGALHLVLRGYLDSDGVSTAGAVPSDVLSDREGGRTVRPRTKAAPRRTPSAAARAPQAPPGS